MKRRLALFMVLAMLISLVPMNVFAGSSNTVNAVPTVKVDAQGTAVLSFEEKVNGDFTSGAQFRVDLNNADARSESPTDGLGHPTAGNTTTDVEVAGNSVIVTILNGGLTSAKDIVSFTLGYDVADEGDVTVDIVSLGTGITSQDGLVIARGAEGATKSKVSGTITIGDTVSLSASDSSNELKTISIEELTVGSIDANEIVKVKMPANFNWLTQADDTTLSLGAAVTAYGELGIVYAHVNPLDKRELEIKVSKNGAGTVGGILISGAKVKPLSDAKYGDVSVTVSAVTGDWTTETFVVGTYKDYGVTVSLNKETIPTIVSGQYSTSSEDVLLQTLVIKEDIADSLITGRKFEIAFPDDVKIAAYKIVKHHDFLVGEDNNPEDYTVDNDNAVEFTVQNGAASKAEIKIEFYVSVAANYAGDITATLSGKALPTDYSIVLGKAVKPATFTVEIKDLKIGVQNQAMGTVVITEPEAGYWAVGEQIYVSMPNTDFEFNEDPTITVTKGDLEIKSENKGKSASFVIKSESVSAPAEVTLKGATIDLDRTLAEGDYNVNVRGSALVYNDADDEKLAKFDVTGVGSQLAFHVITPAPGDTTAGETVVFTIGSADYMVGAVKMTADAAPYINEQGRTMLPLRALANALGVADSNIMWNDAEHSVVIFKGDATLKVIIGQSFFNKNGVMVPMDTQAVIMNSRTFLPLRAMGEALGAKIVWDEATRTVTVN